jgi:hypothetical protein
MQQIIALLYAFHMSYASLKIFACLTANSNGCCPFVEIFIEPVR